MTFFKEGDRVELVVSHPDGNRSLKKGHKGTVVVIDLGLIGVAFDAPFSGGHSFGSLGPRSRGWWMDKRELTKSKTKGVKKKPKARR